MCYPNVLRVKISRSESWKGGVIRDAIRSYGNTRRTVYIVEKPWSCSLATKSREYRKSSSMAVAAAAATGTRRQSSSAAPRRAHTSMKRTHTRVKRASERRIRKRKRERSTFLHRVRTSTSYPRVRLYIKRRRSTRPLTWIAIHIEYGSYGRAFVSETATSVGDRKHAEHSPLAHVRTLEKPVNNWQPRWSDGETDEFGRKWPKVLDSATRCAKWMARNFKCGYARARVKEEN